MGGGSKKTYLAPINTLALTSPSNTASATTTKRTWVKNSYIKDLFYTNAYSSGMVTNISFSSNTVSFKQSASGYGVGFVLNENVVAGETYEVNYSTSTSALFAMFYQSDGTYLTNINLNNSDHKFTVPNNTEYVVLFCTGGTANTTSAYTINGVTKA